MILSAIRSTVSFYISCFYLSIWSSYASCLPNSPLASHKPSNLPKLTDFFKSVPPSQKQVPQTKPPRQKQSTLQSFSGAPQSRHVPPPFQPESLLLSFRFPTLIIFVTLFQSRKCSTTASPPCLTQVSSLRAFHSEAESQHSEGASMRIDSFSTLMHLQPTWLFEDSQQDAAEYF